MYGEYLGEMIRFLVMEFKPDYMKKVIFFFLITISSLINAGAQGTVVSSGTIVFRPGSDVLIDTYKGNSKALSQLGTAIRENKTNILKGEGYVELSSVVDRDLLANNFILNNAAMQASVVRAHLTSRYGLDKTRNFVFRYEGGDESNIVKVRYVKGAIPGLAQQNIYYTQNIADMNAVKNTIARYGDKIPTDSYADNTHVAASPIRKVQPVVVTQPVEPIVRFRHSSEIIYRAYKENGAGLEMITTHVKENLANIQAGNRTIHLTSFIPAGQKSNPAAINLAALRGAMVRGWLIGQIAGLTEENFSFGIDTDSDGLVRVECKPSGNTPQKSKIYFTKEKQNQERIAEVLSWYKISPMASGDMELGQCDMDFVNPDLDPTEITITTGGEDDKIHITIYFRWDKDNIDPTYLTNARTLHTIDSLMSLKSAEYIDTLRITAFASPEGPPVYNQKLSERRAESFRQYILRNYPKFSLPSVLAQGKGENWEGFRHLAEADPNLPRKAEILSIIDNPKLSLEQRQARIVNLDGGRIYKDYIYPKYYPKLRSGASMFVVYNPGMPMDINFEPIAVMVVEPEPDPVVEPEPVVEEIVELPAYHYIRPFAIKTNLLFDAATLFNIEAEIPLGRRFSVLAEWTFPFWGGLGNAGGVAPLPAYSEKYTLQMLSGGLEARYWFPRSKSLDNKAQYWGDYNPLNGWFVGLYGGAGLYDFQWNGKGMQGEFYIASGISAGYAHPIGKYFHMEYSLGFGYVATRYYNYTAMDGHKVVDIRPDGKYDRRQQSFFGPTKLKIALVWIPRFKVNNKKENPANEK